MGAGERLAYHLEGQALYLGKERGWAWWTGTHYDVSPEAERKVTRYAHRSSRRITALALKAIEEGGGVEGKAWETTKVKALAKAGSVAAINNSIVVAQHHPSLAVDYEEMDSHPYLINCANGVLDVTTLELLPHDQRWKLTSCSPYRWNPDADTTFWEAKVLEMMSGDMELVNFLQRAMGWTLIGEGTIRQQIYIHLYGISNSGKGVFARTIQRILGRTQAMSISFAAVGEATTGGPNSDIAQAEGKRMLLVPDTGGNPRWDGEVLKQLTGGDLVSCRELHKPKKVFQPIASLWICSNDKPMPKGAGKHAIFNRGRIVRFRQEYSQDPEKLRKRVALPMDPDLERKLHEDHGEAVLKWGVLGAASYLDSGSVGTCEAIEREMHEYKEGAKLPLEEFVDEFLRTAYDDVEDGELAYEHDDWHTQFVCADDLHKGFSVWCERVGYNRGKEATPNKISRMMNELITNDSRFTDVRSGSYSQSIAKGTRGRAWKQVCWTREGMSLLQSTYTSNNEREPF